MKYRTSMILSAAAALSGSGGWSPLSKGSTDRSPRSLHRHNGWAWKGDGVPSARQPKVRTRTR